jgi:multiple sugar transport system ATP-binding protein
VLGVPIGVRLPHAGGSPITVGVRPETVRLQAAANEGGLRCRFRRRENLGSESILHFDVIGAEPLLVLCKVGNDAANLDRTAGEETMLGLAPDTCHFFDERGQRIDAASVTQRGAAFPPGRAVIGAAG